MITQQRLAAFLFFSLAVSVPLIAHHSAAAFDTAKEQQITGTITQYRFSNPHVYLTLSVKKDDGTSTSMEVEAGAASVLNGLGFTKDSIKIGDVVTIIGSPARKNPQSYMLGKDLHKRDGTYLPLNIASKTAYEAKANAVATGIEGTWFPQFSQLGTVLGGIGKFPLTDKGRTAREARNQMDATHRDCVPIGEPALMFYPVANTIKVQKDRVTMDVDWMDTERTIWIDGRAHPPASQTFLHGHSVGKWEGKTLVVETTNFKEHLLGMSTSMPSSTQKKLTERFALSEDGKSLTYSGTYEDPVYITQAGQWSGKWDFRPGMPHSNQKCDVDLAQRFLKD